ncbi:MAG: PilZ domain-containing protein [Methylococcales bacterium]|nr:PilZ domain-containing protein [Methylococcales bacterium]
MTQHKFSLADDKRHYFRVSDSINLSYRFIDETQIAHHSQTSANLLDNCSLSSALELIGNEAAIIHGKLDKIHSDFADYLKLLDMKIDLIAQAVMALSVPEEITENQTRNANISASGIGFDCHEVLQVGQYLEIKILLVHSTVVIVTYAKVVHCIKNSNMDGNYPYFVGVDYVNMKESDRDLLSKHVAKKQLQQIREQKEKMHPHAA